MQIRQSHLNGRKANPPLFSSWFALLSFIRVISLSIHHESLMSFLPGFRAWCCSACFPQQMFHELHFTHTFLLYYCSWKRMANCIFPYSFGQSAQHDLEWDSYSRKKLWLQLPGNWKSNVLFVSEFFSLSNVFLFMKSYPRQLTDKIRALWLSENISVISLPMHPAFQD